MSVGVTPAALAATLYMRAPDWPRAKAILEGCPTLLAGEADAALEDWLEAAREDPELVASVVERREALERARREGIRSAFAGLVGLPALAKIDGRPPFALLERPEDDEELQRALDAEPALREVRDTMLLQAELIKRRLGSLKRHELWQVLVELLRLTWREWEPGLWSTVVWDIASLAPGWRHRWELWWALEGATLARATTDEREAAQCAQLDGWLAIAWAELEEGDRAMFLEQAVLHYERAAAEWPRDQHPVQWVRAQLSLARAYLERRYGDAEENRVLARAAIERTDGVIDRSSDPEGWARWQFGLGSLALFHSDGNLSARVNASIGHFDAALEALPVDADPRLRALIQAESAAAYLHRRDGDSTRDQREGMCRARAAAEVLDPEEDPVTWALVHHNLGLGYERAAVTGKPADVDQTVAHLREALTVRTAEAMPYQHVDTLVALGDVYFGEGRWVEALTAYGDVLVVAERLVADAWTMTSRREQIPPIAASSARAAHALLELGRLDEAFARLEWGKTVLLSHGLALADVGVEDPDGPAVAELRRRPAETVRDMLARVPAAGALVAPVITSQGGHVFVVPHGAEGLVPGHVVPLPGFDAGVLQRLLGSGEDDGWGGAVRRVGLSKKPVEDWRGDLAEVLEALWDGLMEPVDVRLREAGVPPGAPVLFLPHGGLGVLPLAAAGDGSRCFLDDWTVVQAPSLDAMGEPFSGETSPALVVADPTNTLPWAHQEADIVADILEGTEPLRSERATRAAVLAAAPDAATLHFACHSFFAWDNVLKSSIWLWDGDRLTWADVVGHLRVPSGALVTLSACETGVTESGSTPDEYIGLGAGMLMAGVGSVISSLWSVDDEATSTLMTRIYHRVRAGLSPAAALRDAQREVRDLHPHPHYWAAWTCNGAISAH